jgi:hypothetical protein
MIIYYRSERRKRTESKINEHKKTCCEQKKNANLPSTHQQNMPHKSERKNNKISVITFASKRFFYLKPKTKRNEEVSALFALQIYCFNDNNVY